MRAQELQPFVPRLQEMGGSFGPLPMGEFTTVRIFPIDNLNYPISPTLTSLAQIQKWIDYMCQLRGKGSWAGGPLPLE